MIQKGIHQLDIFAIQWLTITHTIYMDFEFFKFLLLDNRADVIIIIFN